MDFSQPFLAESLALKTYGIHAKGMHFTLCASQRVRKNVLSNGCAAANIRISTDAHELMYRTERPHYGIFLDSNVSGKRCGVRHNDVIGNDAIVRDVRVGHSQAIASDPRKASASGSAAVNRHALANHILIADLKTRVFAFEFQVLGL